MITITIANTHKDYSKIAELADLVWREHYIPIIGNAQVDYMLKTFQSVDAISQQVSDGYSYYFLNYHNDAVGYIAVKEEADALFLSKVYVLSSYRGKKIGKAAMHFIEERAKRMQLKTVQLTVNKYNLESIKAYKKLGFINKGPLVKDIGQGFIMDDYLMEKTLNN
ncbi:GNAT family N-acetyltransferase [Snuella sedimenti]|uniref:GNAT family N-acetyltransferase n=1 Tax=Snuella sedimenti TaxID=2798802 RepID=A0A8J7LNA5_9FLAO|nr:GNAT family N-acetyltransferase [Snuella sedimenti]MBJ6368559.1 GNAT family N-acetyltransferase [Snuella sedimenti]